MGTLEALVLTLLFFLIYVSYGGLGRAVFFNSLVTGEASDPIGAILPYMRLMVCATIILVLTQTVGLAWALSKVPLVFAPFICLAFASSLWAADPKHVVWASMTLCAMWVALPMVVHRLGLVHAVTAFLHLIAIAVIVSAVLAIAVPTIGQHHGLELSGESHAGRWRGMFLHKNGLGPWAACGSVLLFSHSWLCRGPRLYWWLARVCALACLVFCGSATALVTAVFLVACLGMFQMLRRLRVSVVVTALALCLPIALIVLLPLTDAVLDLAGRDTTLTGRTDIWALAVDRFWMTPWLGNGFESLGGPEFLGQIEQYFSQAIPGPESGYFVLILDLGIVGAILYLVPFLTALRNGFEWLRHVRLADRAALEFVMMIVLSTAVYSFTESSSMDPTGFVGLIAYTAFFTLMAVPRSPASRLRGEFRLAKHANEPVRATSPEHVGPA